MRATFHAQQQTVDSFNVIILFCDYEKGVAGSILRCVCCVQKVICPKTDDKCSRLSDNYATKWRVIRHLTTVSSSAAIGNHFLVAVR